MVDRTRCLTGLHLRLESDEPTIAVHRIIATVMSGPNRGQAADIKGPRLTIGSGGGADLVLEDDTVSRLHCELVPHEKRWLVRDLGSTNGTSQDGVWIREAYISSGGRFVVGESEILFEGHTTWTPAPASAAAQFGELVGDSPSMRALFGVFERVAPTNLNVLLSGETGTGKELAARAIHHASPRGEAPLVVVDCGALSHSLVESHLFGHERGAFTGADKAHRGAFERASGGTIFLDEIGELPLDLQPKLLRVLERREILTVGGNEMRDVDVRIIAATHRDLDAMVEAGTFREDLFYRLAEIIVEMPALRDRPSDVPILAKRILAQMDGPPRTLSADALRYLGEQTWGGNVRELRNVLRRAAVLSPTPLIERSALVPPGPSKVAPAHSASDLPLRSDLPIREAREQWLRTMEKRYLENLWSKLGEDVGALATHMDVHRKSVYRLLRQHGLIE